MGEEGRPSSGRRSNDASGPVTVVWREREEVGHERRGSPVLLRHGGCRAAAWLLVLLHLFFFEVATQLQYLLMEKVRIPTTMLLDAMPQKLKLPYAVCSTHKARIIGLDATIEFYPSDHQLKKGLPKKSMSIYEREEAEDRLASEALKYMEASYS